MCYQDLNECNDFVDGFTVLNTREYTFRAECLHIKSLYEKFRGKISKRARRLRNYFKKHFPNSRLAVIYGQTESSVNSIFFIREEERYRKPLLGTPIEGTRLYVTDEEGSTVKPLRSGEILVAGRHISPGYWKKSEITDEVFHQDEELGRLYWTGDNIKKLRHFIMNKEFSHL